MSASAAVQPSSFQSFIIYFLAERKKHKYQSHESQKSQKGSLFKELNTLLLLLSMQCNEMREKGAPCQIRYVSVSHAMQCTCELE